MILQIIGKNKISLFFVAACPMQKQWLYAKLHISRLFMIVKLITVSL